MSFPTRYIAAAVTDMRMQPQPPVPIPIWIGGNSPSALERAVRLGDGWHGSRVPPAEIAPMIKGLRTKRPDAGFAISLRVHWNGKDDAGLRALLHGCAAAGVDHAMVQPEERGLEAWLGAVERVAKAGEGV
ncbi:MAG: LLM class flavin-dependent oxidoreductase [Alphaproteobacteria bacterium]|nr:LLM class flavin-dependent oxidoreductase [Alphaproteobacteria bacterium]